MDTVERRTRNNMKIVFMGTPDFSVPTLKSLVESGHEVAACVTQPDKPKGRGKAVLHDAGKGNGRWSWIFRCISQRGTGRIRSL